MSSFMIQSLLESRTVLNTKTSDHFISSSSDKEATVTDIVIKTEPELRENNVTTDDEQVQKQMFGYSRSNIISPDSTLRSPSDLSLTPSPRNKHGLLGDGAESPSKVSPNIISSPSNSSSHDQKPAHSYVAIIAMAILESSGQKLVLSDIYKYILDKYPYFKNKGQGWRNSVRHNLSLNQCFAKAGRAENGKGNYWTIHPANMDDFKKGDFRRRLTRRSRRKYFSVNELSQLNPLISPVSLLKHDHPRTDELLSALFKYNLSNLVSSQNNSMLSNHLAALSQSPFSLQDSSLSHSIPSSLSSNNVSPGAGEMSSLSSSTSSLSGFSPSKLPNLSLSSVGAPSSSVSGGSSTQLLQNPPSLQLSSSISSLLNHDSRDQYLPTLLSKKLYTTSPTPRPTKQPAPLDSRLTDALNSLNLPSLTANASLLKSHLLASYKMQQWLSHCEKALNSKSLTRVLVQTEDGNIGLVLKEGL
ncbi:forkhead box protein B1-like [Bolinopsis microptera]|uniref:forkhead box protein B1-like n=1 Tax=Bolinopsis microptera TaxID=2820187 RepID=UPI00307A3FC0